MSDISVMTDPFLARMHTADAALVRAKQNLSPQKMQQIEEAASEFEAMFISEMLGNMFDSVGVDPLFGGGEAEETWRGLMVEEYGKQIARTGGIGLSADIKAKMIEMQAQADMQTMGDAQ